MPRLDKPVKRELDLQSQPDAEAPSERAGSQGDADDIEIEFGDDDMSVHTADEDPGPFAAMVSQEQLAARKYAKALVSKACVIEGGMCLGTSTHSL